jgi:hypothetical protein
VKWTGYGSVSRATKAKSGMKESGMNRIRKEYDPEYTPARDVSPKRACLNKWGHPSDRCRTSLRVLWDLSKKEAMIGLMDGGFCTDVCVNSSGQELPCKDVLAVAYSFGKQEQRQLCCSGVKSSERHRMHWLHGSVFQGHTKLDAKDVLGVLESFGASKTV